MHSCRPLGRHWRPHRTSVDHTALGLPAAKRESSALSRSGLSGLHGPGIASLQAYLWRWEIEVNFRDEKSLLGVGQAQVRTKASVEKVPSLIVAAYAMLLLAGTSASDSSKMLPKPKWQQSQPEERCSTQQMIGLLRSQLWEKAMMMNLRHFASTKPHTRTQINLSNSLASAVCYAIK